MTNHQMAVKQVHAALVKRTQHEYLTQIAHDADVPYGWLQQFFYGNIYDPGWARFTALAKHLGFKLDDL